MELIIIALIAVEVIVVSPAVMLAIRVVYLSGQAFVRDGPELWDAIFGTDLAASKEKARRH